MGEQEAVFIIGHVMDKKTSFTSFHEMVCFYEEHLQAGLLKEIEICRKVVASDAFSDAEKAEIILMGGHQWRLMSHHKERNEAIDRLKDAAPWERHACTSFEDVYKVVYDAVADVKYVGPLAWYDAAKRAACCCGCEPDRWVYLNSGARAGARALLGDERVSCSAKKIETAAFRKYFPTLSAMHIENLLCIMKAFFKKGGIKLDVEVFFMCGCCLRWTCSKELKEKILTLFPELAD